MLCPSCSSTAPAEAAFCPKCGQRLTAPPAPGALGANPSAAAAAPATPAERFRAAMPATPNPEPEHDLWQGTYTPKAMIGRFIFAGLITLAAIALAILVLPYGWIVAVIVIPLMWAILLLEVVIKRLGVEYRLTTQRFLHKRGLLRRVADQILLVDIDDVTYSQGPVERILNIGVITIHSNDASDPKLRLAPIENVQQVADLIDNSRREERRKRAIYMASA